MIGLYKPGRGSISVAQSPKLVQRDWWHRRLLLVVLSSAIVILSARVAAVGGALNSTTARTEEIPGPPGRLRLCPSDSPIASMLAQAVGQAGVMVGCFVSSDQVQLRAVPRAVDYPVEYAFAIRFAQKPSGPYTTRDMEHNLSLTEETWRAFQPLWELSKPQYERRINDLLVATTNVASEPLTLVLAQPLLVSIDSFGELGFSVVSIRQRKISLGANFMVSTAVDGSGLVLVSGQLTRLSFVRELREPSDVELVKKAIGSWIRETSQTSISSTSK